MNILLIVGGWSSEREVSLSSGKEVLKALESRGHNTTLFDPRDSFSELPSLAKQHDFAFIALHGSPGEDGLIQAILDRVGCPYQGADAAGSLAALNKAAAKTLFTEAGLPTAKWCFLPHKPDTHWRPDFDFPLFIKANTGGSSLNMERVETEEQLEAALDKLFTQGDSYLVEPVVTGMEVTCGVLGTLENKKEIPIALDPILIKPKLATLLFDYKSKYSPNGAEEICPAPFPDALTKRIQEISLKAHTVLGLHGYSRSDFIVPENGEPVLLETNTLPGLTVTSLLPKETAVIGLSYADLVERLIELGLARHRRLVK